ncbi:MAG: Gfo/Idh/MocA family oxidoreductase, partial [Candidatus Marinimicrobia bacterium]|nr:Gfo/Idh/MocA family oxidoreductase [Candidatus Neomarinimicrobiota bacterium]
MKKQVLKIGIVGVGRFGSRHLDKWMHMDHIDLIGFNDIDPNVCKHIEGEKGIPAFPLDDLINKVDILDIVVPAVSHYPIALQALEAGKHIFIEKPFTETPEQARKLAKLAKSKDLKIGIGHIERFNPVYQELKNTLTSPPESIMAFRQGPFIPKVGLDVSIIMELMVHDIDIIRKLIPSPIKHIHASGDIIHSDKI